MTFVQTTPTLGDQHLRRLAETLQTTMAHYGYEPVDTPIVQPAELFLTKAGDRLVTRLFTFERNGRQLALRPEFTATAAYDYVRRPSGLAPVARWQYGGPIFIDEHGGFDAPQYSVGAELIGLSGPLAEAEIMAMAVDGLRAANVTDVRLLIGHVGLMRRLLERFHLDSRTQRVLLSHLSDLKNRGKDYVLERLGQLMLKPQDSAALPSFVEDAGAAVNTQQMLDALLDATQRNITMGGRTRHDIVRRLLQKRQRAADYEQIVAAVDFLTAWGAIDLPPAQAFQVIEQHIGGDSEATAMLGDWRRLVELLEASGVSSDHIRIRPDLARTWDYYTGVVFEIYARNGEHLAGGGRYDELTALVGGSGDVPAAGFVYYPAEILLATPDTLPQPNRQIAIQCTEANQTQALAWAQRLRSAGRTVILLENDGSADTGVEVGSDGSLHWNSTTYTSDTFNQFLDDTERA